jgi:hypothetical protein
MSLVLCRAEVFWLACPHRSKGCFARKKTLFEGSCSRLCFIAHGLFMVGFRVAFDDTVLAIAFAQAK